MKNISLFFVLFVFISINYAKAENKVSYIDIDYLLSNTVAGKSLMESIKGEEEIKINKFKSKEEEFKNKEKQILAKKNLITKEEITKELKLLQINFQKYRKDKLKEVDELKVKRNKNIINFLNQINPIIEKYMEDNSITMLLDKKNIFIANKNSDITLILIELIDNKIKSIDIN